MTHIKIAAAVEAAADGFVDVILLNAVAGFKVGDGAGTHVETLHGVAELREAGGIGLGNSCGKAGLLPIQSKNH